jgi:hypothetical protein
MAARGISTREHELRAQGVSEDYIKKSVEIDEIVNKYWLPLLNAEEDEVLDVKGLQFEVIDKESEVLPNNKTTQTTYLLDDLARSWMIKHTSGDKAPVIKQSNIISRIGKSAAIVKEKKEQVQDAYSGSAEYVGKKISSSAKKIGSFFGRTAKTAGRAGKRVQKTVRKL